MQATATIDAAIAGAAARLRRIRDLRGLTITDVAERTAISKSTLSRLETGQRRPTLELLLPLARLYDVSLDELVGAPDLGDPRTHLKARQVKGRIVLPLTHNPHGMQAWKIVIPASQAQPAPRVHEGYEWLYVLSGRMRLIIGTSDQVLEAGELADFATSEPHWFGSTGEGPAEVLSLFSRPGERMRPIAPQQRGDHESSESQS